MKQVEMNKNMKLSELNGLRLSPHFTLGELCKTSHQTADGNIPSRVVIENLRNLFLVSSYFFSYDLHAIRRRSASCSCHPDSQ